MRLSKDDLYSWLTVAFSAEATRLLVMHERAPCPLQILFTQTVRTTGTSQQPRDRSADPRALKHDTATPTFTSATAMMTTMKQSFPLRSIPICDTNKMTIVTGPCILLKASTVAQQVQALRPLKQIKPNQEPEILRCKRRIDFQKLGYSLPRSQPATVHRRNARERNRVKLVNLGFETLREHVPSGKVNKKLSKVETLRSAVEYIRELKNVLDCYDHSTPQSPMNVDSYDPSVTDTDMIGASPGTSDTSSMCSGEQDHASITLADCDNYVDDTLSVVGGDHQQTFSVTGAPSEHQLLSSDSSSPGSVCSESSFDSLSSIDDSDILRFSRWLAQLYTSSLQQSLADADSQIDSLHGQIS